MWTVSLCAGSRSDAGQALDLGSSGRKGEMSISGSDGFDDILDCDCGITIVGGGSLECGSRAVFLGAKI